jgi:hypothetical protein
VNNPPTISHDIPTLAMNTLFPWTISVFPVAINPSSTQPSTDAYGALCTARTSSPRHLPRRPSSRPSDGVDARPTQDNVPSQTERSSSSYHKIVASRLVDRQQASPPESYQQFSPPPHQCSSPPPHQRLILSSKTYGKRILVAAYVGRGTGLRM